LAATSYAKELIIFFAYQFNFTLFVFHGHLIKTKMPMIRGKQGKNSQYDVN